MKLKYKISLPNSFYLMLLALVLFYAYDFKRTVERLDQEQKRLEQASAAVRDLNLQSEMFLSGNLPYPQWKAGLDKAGIRLAGIQLQVGMDQIQGQFEHVHQLMDRNAVIDAEVTSLTASSINNSNGYIKQVCARLADPRTSPSVSTLERLVIVGANINTTSNYEVRVQFEKMRERLDAKKDLLNLLETLMANVEQDVKRLAGTPFAQLPVLARASNLKIRELTLEYIRNAEDLQQSQKVALGGLDKNLAAFDELSIQGEARLFSQIRSRFISLVVVLLLTTIVGLALGGWLSSSIASALARIIQRLDGAAGELGTVSHQVAQAGEQLAAGAGEQASGVEQITASLEEAYSMTRRNAENARQADAVVGSARQSAAEGSLSMSRLTEAIGSIKTSSDQTARIIKTIDEIAFQTNLLALNAAVEAARAGDAGKGFAVVAEEVRNLARRSAEAARNTTDLVRDVQQSAGHGVAVGAEVAARLARIQEEVTQVAGLVASVAAASQEQSRGIEQINTAMAQMDRVIQTNAASAEESAASGQHLATQATALGEIIGELVHVVEG